MKYISIGAVMTEGTEHILDVCRGSRSYHLTGELASRLAERQIWLCCCKEADRGAGTATAAENGFGYSNGRLRL